MNDELDQSKRAGTFTISPGKDIYGELTFAGPDTSLYLRDKEFFDILDIPEQCVKGTLHDLTKVTLIKCVPTSGPGSHSHGNEAYCFATLFPNYVLYGNRYINPNEKTITGVRFEIDDASVLFNDFDAFGKLIDARPFIKQIVRSNPLNREIPIGPDPQICYFTGKREIFSAETVIGKVFALHSPDLSTGGPNGVHLNNRIVIYIDFKKACTFDDSIGHTLTLLKFLELMVGRSQYLRKLSLRIKSDDEFPSLLKVYWSMRPRRNLSKDKNRRYAGNVLIDAVSQPDKFARVLSNWLARHKDWHDARWRFSNSFGGQGYDIDRLIRSANMFDILPSSAVSRDLELSDELIHAKKMCSKIFKALPKSPERDSVLSALGRIGKSALKNKICYRSTFLISPVGKSFPDVFTVIDEAVNCRNHYVHGSKASFDYSNELSITIFLINTLEFVFAASDLIEAGWDVVAWNKTSTTEHPFGEYSHNYPDNLHKLKSLLA